MAQMLELFEQECQPHLPPEKAEKFKGIVRQKLNALALDACEMMALKPDEEINGAAIELRDHMSAEGRPVHRRTTA